MKKLIATAVAGTILFGSVLGVNATGLKDVFSAKYYADQYPDLKEAFGYDEELLWQHFLEYGLEEGRNMSPVLDVQEYRKKYADLDEAFGDDWDAYVKHFFEFGINENRDTGTDFDVKSYISAYGDIKEAFGDDYAAVVEHYLNHGIEENRNLGNTSVIQAASGNTGSSGEMDDPGKVDYLEENVYDENGVLIRVNYTYQGKTYYYDLFTYDESGRVIKMTEYDAQKGTVLYEIVSEYENDVLKKDTCYASDGSVSWEREYNENGTVVKYTYYNGNYTTVVEYDADGNVVSRITVDKDGKITNKTEYVKNEQGETIRRSYIYLTDGSYIVSISDSDNTYIGQEDYDASGVLQRTLTVEPMENGNSKHIWKDAAGVVYLVGINNEKKQNIENIWYDAEGNVTGHVYNSFDEEGNIVWVKEISRDGSYSTREYDADYKIQKQSFYAADDSLKNYVTFIYNEQKQVERENWYDSNGELQSYVINSYDAEGKRVSSQWYDKDGNPTS